MRRVNIDFTKPEVVFEESGTFKKNRLKEFAKWLMVGGGFIIIAGILIYFFYDKLRWFGNLPGDIRIERENFRFYMPITSMILVSLILSLLIFLVRKIFNDH